MGWVWEATHEFTGKQVAIKFLKGGKEQDRRRFVREVRAASAVRHANVIDVHDFIELPDGTLAMAMELLRGETLGAVLQREKKIPLAALAQIVLPVIDALDAAHRAGIIHRDLKPDNVFLEKDGDDSDAPPRIKVLDFGVAKLTASEGLAARTQALTGTGTMVGTPYYMSPEQVVSEKDLDGRADIWSLGVLLYECLSGVRPTEADNVGRVLKRILTADFEPISTYCADLPADVSALVMKMLAGDRDELGGDGLDDVIGADLVVRSIGLVSPEIERDAGGGRGEPGLERGASLKPADTLDHTKPGFLRHFFGRRPIWDVGEGDTHQRGMIVVHQCHEGSLIAAAQRHHQR